MTIINFQALLYSPNNAVIISSHSTARSNVSIKSFTKILVQLNRLGPTHSTHATYCMNLHHFVNRLAQTVLLVLITLFTS